MSETDKTPQYSPPLSQSIKPDDEDFKFIEQRHGRLGPDAPDAALARHYRLALTRKLLRLMAEEEKKKDRQAE